MARRMIYRSIRQDEAEKFWGLMNQLDYETKYMLYEPGERIKNIPFVENRIKSALENNDFLLVAEEDGALVGYISAQKEKLNRTKHTAYIVTGILKDYRGKGVGTEFFKRLDLWAKEEELTRLELTVICENEVAKHLYEKSGFEVEGVKRKSVFTDGRFLDEYYMSKLI